MIVMMNCGIISSVQKSGIFLHALATNQPFVRRWIMTATDCTTKQCSKCKIEKSLQHFSPAGTRKNGDIFYQSHCKECRNTHSHEVYAQKLLDDQDGTRQAGRDHANTWRANNLERARKNDRD